MYTRETLLLCIVIAIITNDFIAPIVRNISQYTVRKQSDEL